MVIEKIKFTFYDEAEYNKALNLADTIFTDSDIEANQVKSHAGYIYWEIAINDPIGPTDMKNFLQQMA